jgi:hypothetical protein
MHASTSLALAVIDLTEVQQRAAAAAVFHDAPVAVLFAVFAAPITFQEHADVLP